MQKNKKNIIAVVVVIISLLFIHFLFNHLSFSATDSVGYHLFYITKHFKKLKRWDYVLFPMPKTHVKEIQKEIKTFKTIVLVKQAACLPGDNLTVKGRKFYCNKIYLCTAKKIALNGEKLSHFKFNGIIPKGYFFAFGSNINSYDSRYYGLVPIKNIISVATPIL